MKKLLLLTFLGTGIASFGQSGPGGQGTTDGTSNLVLWLRADAGVLEAAADPAEDGDALFQWTDQSGYNYHALVGGGTPEYDAVDANFNNMPSILFVDGDTEWLTIEDDADEAPQLDNTAAISIFYVYNPDNSSGVRAHISKRDGNGSAQSYVFYENNSQNSRINSNNDAGANITGGNTYINATTYQNGDFDHFLNQSSGGGVSGGTSSIPNNNSDLNIGEFQSGDGRTFDGNMAEIIIIREYLTNAERIVVESYLGSKYGITLTNDFWDEATYSSYDNEIAGIGQHTDASVADAATSAVISISGGADRGNGEWLFWGHDSGDFSSYTSTEVITGSGHQRLAREWVINETGELGNVTVSIPASSLPSTGLSNPEFYLYVDADGVFTDATSNTMTLNSGNYEVTLDLDEGDRIAVAFAPPAPAGITTSLAFWFDASSGVENTGSAATNGQSVTVWQDLSSNDADGQNGTSPTYYDANTINFNPIVRFDAASSQYMEFDMTGLEGADYTMMAVVQRASSTGSQYVLGSQNNAADALLMGYSSNTQFDARNSSTAAANTAVSGFDSPVEGPAIVAVNYNSTNLDIDEFRNGTNNSGTTATSTDYAATGYTGNLGRALSGNYLDGDVAEIVAFDANLSSGDFNAMASQLAIKYGVDLGMDYVDEQANLLWDISDNVGYDNDVTAIGTDGSFSLDQKVSKSAADSLVLSTTSDFTSLNSNGARTSLSDGQFVFVANNDDAYNIDQTYNGTANVMLDRAWRVREVGSPGAINVGVPSASVNVNVMLVSTDPTFVSGVTEVSLATSGSYVYASYDFTDGDYFTFVNDPSEIWYSYLSGNWSDPQNWTLDGAISALYVNPDSKVPAAGDSVVIKSGRTITMDLNDVNVTKVELIGTLNLGATTGHDLGYLEGAGTLRLSGASGVDNYPTAIDTAFYEPLEGGTVRYFGSSDIELNQIRRYNNLVINMDNNAQVTTMTADSIYVFGDFTVQRGIFQINDNVATNDLALQVSGGMIVEANGTVDVGTTNARHELNLYGDFTNYGDVDFTNRTSQTTGSEATNGIVDFNLLSGIRDQLITLEGLTHFYRIEVNKGTDKTYVADFQASDPTYFELYGPANQSHGAVAQLTSNSNAIGLLIGTLKLGSNIDVGPLNTGGNYNVSEGAELWINGGTAFKNGGTAIVPYGNIRVSAGTLDADVNSGITSRANGTLYMEGGTVTIRQFRTSVFGATNQGGIVQTGGILNITGGTINNNYCPLNLTYSGNAFIMSGGVMNVSGANTKGGVFINSDTENILTGGTLNFISSTTNPFVISTRAGFFNLNLSKTNASGGDFQVMTNQSGPSGTDETIEDLPLEILNDITLDNSDGNTVTLDMSGNNLQVQGSLNIDAGSSLDMTNMTLIFDGAGSSQLNIGLATALQLDSLQINKNQERVNTNISNGPDPAVQIDHYLNVTSGNFDPATFNVIVDGNINVADTVGTSMSTGIISMTGSSAQTITSSGGAIYDLLINNANGVSLTGDFGVPDQLDLNTGIFDINTYKLTCGNDIATTGTFGTTLMIQTNGNASDGGLEYYYDGSTADPALRTYPIGTDLNTLRYTPATLDLSGIDVGNTDDGNVAISLSDTELQTTNLSGGNILSYYWSSTNSGFATAPTAIYTFNYDASDDDAADEGNFVPGRVLNVVDFNRAEEGAANVNTTTNIITFDNDGGGGITLENADYTAGVGGLSGRFDGSPQIYYSYASNGVWFSFQDASNWSTTADPTDATNAHSDYPRAGDIAIIGSSYSGGGTGRHQVRSNPGTDVTVASLIFDSQAGGTALVVTDMSRLRMRGGTTLAVGTMSGTGELVQDIGTAGQTATITGDLGDFLEEDDNGWFFWFQSVTDVTISDRFTYPIFRTFGSDGTLTFSSDVTAHGAVIDSDTELRVTNNFTIDSLTQIGSNNSGTLAFRNVGSNVTYETGNLYYSDDANNSVTVENAGSDVHTLKVNGDINLDTGSSFDLTSAAGAQVQLELAGTGTHTFTNTTGQVPELYRLIMNKGTDTTSVFTMNTDFNLNGPVNVAPSALEIQKGKLVLNDAGVSMQVADGIDYSIPEGSGLEITQGALTMDNSVIILDGLLRVNGGSLTLMDTDIEYSNTGYALINISSGSFEVGNIIRRATTTSTGILKYRQTGGTVLIASDDAPTYSPSRASFEVINPNSEFTLTGGSFTIQRGVTGDNNISLLLQPATYDITGSTITLGNANTPSYGANYFNLKTSIPLNNLTIFDDADDNMPPVRLLALPLTVNGTLDIAANTGLISNGFDVTLNGDFSNEGTYTNSTATTTFGSATSQSITGAGTFTIYDLTKTGAGEAQTNQNLSLLHDLRVNAGTLNMQGNTISLQNDAYIESVLSNTSGSNGLIFNGTSNQDLYGVPNNTVTLGTVTVENPAGVDIADGNGYNFDLTHRLRLNGGVFNIGGSLVTILRGGYVEEVSTFNENNMVQTNSSFTDNGFRQEFYAVAADTTVFFPVGELKYTPVQFDFDAGTTQGDIRIRPANEMHPTVVDNTEPMTETEIVDSDYVLQYYWIVIAQDVTNANGTATFSYDHGDIRTVGGTYDTTHYISARLLSNGVTWDKYAPTNFHGGTTSFRVPLSSANSSLITGDYTAGVGSSDGTNNDIEGALPDQLAQYTSNFSGSGNYSTDGSWTPIAPSPALSSGIGPVGAQITISTGDDVNLDISNIRLYSTHIEAGAILRVPTGSIGNRLGTVTGTGTIVLEDTELLPTGEYSAFLACNGGGLQYSGSTDYSVLSGISQIRNVTFDGTGTRFMPNNALDVCDVLTINGPTVDFDAGQTYNVGDNEAEADGMVITTGAASVSNGSVINVTGDFTMNGGTLTGNAGTEIQISDDITYTAGTLNWNNMDLILDGTTEQLIDGDFTGVSQMDNLTLNNTSSTGVTINSGDVVVDGLLTFTDGLFNTSSTETLTLTTNGDWTGASSASYVTGPITKEDVAVSSTFEFPVGKAARYAPAAVADVGTGGDTWTAEYFTSMSIYDHNTFDSSDPGSGKNAIEYVVSTDRWEITAADLFGSNSAQVRISFGAHNGFSSQDDIRVTWWDGVDSRWENVGAVTSGDGTTGTSRSEDFISFSTEQFALSSAPEVPLPVDLVFFQAAMVNGATKIEWQTASEINNDYFEVQRSKDGENWEVIRIVDGAGDSEELLNYYAVDATPYAGLSYYRLQQYDYDGLTEIFDPVAVNNTLHGDRIQFVLKPNPTTSNNINFELSTGDDHTPIFMKLMDLTGKVSFVKELDPSELRIDSRIEPSEILTAGLYFITIQQGSNTFKSKLIIRE